MTDRLELNRRQFVVTTAAVGGGMALGFAMPASALVLPEPWKTPPAAAGAEINAWIVISPDDTITIRVGQTEIGTGTITAMPMIVCEELECDWSKVNAEYASGNRSLRENNVYGRMSIGGSASVTQSRDFLQKAGANARERLKMAAAAEWNVPVTEITAVKSVLTHTPTGRKLRYGQVAAKAVPMRLEKDPVIKHPSQFNFLGKENDKAKRFDTPLKVNGSAVFGIDVKVPGAVIAAVKVAPVFGAKVKSFDAASAKARPGVIDVIEMGKNKKHSAATFASQLNSGVAVIANTYWQARTALDAMAIEWDEGDLVKISTQSHARETRAALDKPGGAIANQVGDAVAGLKDARRTVEAIYETPFIDHALLEPLSATASVTADKIEIWVSTQNPISVIDVAAEESGMSKDKIFCNTTFIGGGFGRRGVSDDVRQAVFLSKTLNRPVKVMWSREETLRQGTYRPTAMAKFKGGLDADGNISTMHVTYAGHSTTVLRGAALGNGIDDKNKIDANQLRGIRDVDYALPNFLVEWHAVQTHVPTGAWRGPGVCQNAFMYESFIDEMALAGGKDPVAMRRNLLRNAKDPGWLKVLNEVAEKSKWGKPMPKGSAQGMAMTIDHGTITAAVVEVSVSQGGEVKVHTLDMAFDIGHVFYKDAIIAQIEGGTAMGLSSLLYEEITLRNGRVVEGNFDDYRIVRIDEMPQVNVHFGGLTGGDKVTGVGEPSTVIVPAAVANAIFRATGKRVRSMPLKNLDLSWS